MYVHDVVVSIEPPVGIEPTTFGLAGQCSVQVELRGQLEGIGTQSRSSQPERWFYGSWLETPRPPLRGVLESGKKSRSIGSRRKYILRSESPVPAGLSTFQRSNSGLESHDCDLSTGIVAPSPKGFQEGKHSGGLSANETSERGRLS